MQLLYQMDLAGVPTEGPEPQVIDACLDEAEDNLDLPENVDTKRLREGARELAVVAWKGHRPADRLLNDLAPQWPTHRQPPVDRAILRLAHHEMTTGHAPVRVVINEAVELAKRFGSEQSPSFINGVVDRMARRLREEGKLIEPDPATAAEEVEPAPANPQNWLDDALNK